MWFAIDYNDPNTSEQCIYCRDYLLEFHMDCDSICCDRAYKEVNQKQEDPMTKLRRLTKLKLYSPRLGAHLMFPTNLTTQTQFLSMIGELEQIKNYEKILERFEGFFINHWIRNNLTTEDLKFCRRLWSSAKILNCDKSLFEYLNEPPPAEDDKDPLEWLLRINDCNPIKRQNLIFAVLTIRELINKRG